MAATHIKVELDDAVYAAVVAELGLRRPPSVTMNHSGKHAELKLSKGDFARGFFDPKMNQVVINSQYGGYARESLPILVRHLRFTLLHELRHVWQHENWSPEQIAKAREGRYPNTPIERDANRWAEENIAKFPGLLMVRRRPVGGKTGFGRMDTKARG